MEDSPLFNCGKGSVYTYDETNEMDASIMDGKTGLAGAVSGLTRVKNPITAARLVMEKSDHVMLSGPGANQFAEKHGCVMVEPSYFQDQTRLEQLRSSKAKSQVTVSEDHGNSGDSDKKFGTVGAVALDMHGNLAAATSTGGVTNKRYGRIGDSPIIGAGTYASNDTCAVSCTGHGEYFIREVVAYDVSAVMKYKEWSLQKSADFVVLDKLEKKDGRGGIIAVDKDGNFSMTFNTEGMYRGVIKYEGIPEVGIYKEMLPLDE